MIVVSETMVSGPLFTLNFFTAWVWAKTVGPWPPLKYKEHKAIGIQRTQSHRSSQADFTADRASNARKKRAHRPKGNKRPQPKRQSRDRSFDPALNTGIK